MWNTHRTHRAPSHTVDVGRGAEVGGGREDGCCIGEGCTGVVVVVGTDLPARIIGYVVSALRLRDTSVQSEKRRGDVAADSIENGTARSDCLYSYFDCWQIPHRRSPLLLPLS